MLIPELLHGKVNLLAEGRQAFNHDDLNEVDQILEWALIDLPLFWSCYSYYVHGGQQPHPNGCLPARGGSSWRDHALPGMIRCQTCVMAATSPFPGPVAGLWSAVP